MEPSFIEGDRLTTSATQEPGNEITFPRAHVTSTAVKRSTAVEWAPVLIARNGNFSEAWIFFSKSRKKFVNSKIEEKLTSFKLGK